MEVAFTVFGEQRPQGSKTCRVIYRNGKPVTAASGRIVTATIEANPHTKEWRRQVSDAAYEAMIGKTLLDGPVALHLTVYRVRPKGHFGSGKNSSAVKGSAFAYPTTKPDLLKLARAIEDAMSGIVYRDDNQVVRHDLQEFYGGQYRTDVRVVPLPKTVDELKCAANEILAGEKP
jgi:Holliday junction resolvase RusA-like endonuclease